MNGAVDTLLRVLGPEWHADREYDGWHLRKGFSTYTYAGSRERPDLIRKFRENAGRGDPYFEGFFAVPKALTRLSSEEELLLKLAVMEDAG